MKLQTLILPLAVSFTLSGCVVGAVADLAATTVVTAGKLAVKGTGALISAAIPDGDDEDEKKAKKKAHKEERRETAQPVQTGTPQPQVYSQPQNSGYAYPSTAATTTPQTVSQPRYITIDANGQAHETTAPYQIQMQNPTAFEE